MNNDKIITPKECLKRSIKGLEEETALVLNQFGTSRKRLSRPQTAMSYSNSCIPMTTAVKDSPLFVRKSQSKPFKLVERPKTRSGSFAYGSSDFLEHKWKKRGKLLLGKHLEESRSSPSKEIKQNLRRKQSLTNVKESNAKSKSPQFGKRVNIDEYDCNEFLLQDLKSVEKDDPLTSHNNLHRNENEFQKFNSETQRIAIGKETSFFSEDALSGTKLVEEKQRLTVSNQQMKRSVERKRSLILQQRKRFAYITREHAVIDIQRIFRGYIKRLRMSRIRKPSMNKHVVKEFGHDSPKEKIVEKNGRARPHTVHWYTSDCLPQSKKSNKYTQRSSTASGTSNQKKEMRRTFTWNGRNISDTTFKLVSSSSHDLHADSTKVRLFGEDGSANPKLRDAIDSVINSTKFDSVPHLLASTTNIEDSKLRSTGKGKLNTKTKKILSVNQYRPHLNEESKNIHDSINVSVRDVRYSGFDTLQVTQKECEETSTNLIEKESVELNSNPDEICDGQTLENSNAICFNCWSSSDSQKCSLHEKLSFDPSDDLNETTVLCNNWNFKKLMKRYRIKEIPERGPHEVFSLQYHKTAKEFTVVKEDSHPIYRILSHHIAWVNFQLKSSYRVRSWLKSLVEHLKIQSSSGEKWAKTAEKLQQNATLRNLFQLQKLKKELCNDIPVAPVTGTSLPERHGKIKVLMRESFLMEGNVVVQKLVVDGPTPVPHNLYRRREYVIPDPKIILLDWKKSGKIMKATYESHSKSSFNPFALIDELALELGNDENSASKPTRNKYVKQSIPSDDMSGDATNDLFYPLETIKFATLKRIGCSNNSAIGGLSAELIITQIVTTKIPPQFGNFNICDKTLLLPHTNSTTHDLSNSLQVDKPNLIYIDRPLINYITNICYPRITVKVGLGQNDRHPPDFKKVEEGSESYDFGFRTAIGEDLPYINCEIKAHKFVPSEDIATPNTPCGLPMMATKADLSYPFCETKSRENTVNDLAYLLVPDATSSFNKPQLFTSVGIQEVGRFMRDCNIDGQLGRFYSIVTRSWPRMQACKFRRYFTDDDKPYWYDHESGEIRWEKPLDDNKKTIKEGGIYIDDSYQTNHFKDHTGILLDDPAGRHLRRKIFLQKHETSAMKSKRIKHMMKSKGHFNDAENHPKINLINNDRKLPKTDDQNVAKMKLNLKDSVSIIS